MKLLITDANILIDLSKLELLKDISQLGFIFYTTDFILAEIEEAQKEEIDVMISAGKLTVITSDAEKDITGITGLLAQSTGLSFEDCSAWYYCKKLKGILLTGDGNLRKIVFEDGIEVRGIIYLFDELISHGIITCEQAIEKMEHLVSFNNRLPKQAIDQRIMLWKKGQTFSD